MSSEFKTHNVDGTEKRCKFCHKHVWWSKIYGRWYEPDGKTLHVVNCELSAAHYRERAYDASEARRKEGQK